MGVHICLGDFGVGAAAFDYLRCIQVDYVKIDGSFVREAARSKFSGAFIKSISALCTELGIQTIAEMVEDRAAAKLLRAAGVDHGQGWHFGKPSAELPWEGEAYGAAAKPAGRADFNPRSGARLRRARSAAPRRLTPSAARSPCRACRIYRKSRPNNS